MSAPKVFVSYSWDDEQHKEWVKQFAAALRRNGIETILDQWHAVPGDQLPAFMEQSIRESDFVLYICTPRYKEKSDKRDGGAGYEGDIITGELFVTRNQRKFIPVLRKGEWRDAAPSWSSGKYYIDLHGEPYNEQNYQTLLRALHGKSEEAPPVMSPTKEEDFEFVNREIELATLEKLYDSYWQYALVSAPTGYGKSRLLKRLIERINDNDELRRKWNYRYVDLAKCENPDDATTYLWEAICERKLAATYSSDDAARQLNDYILNHMSRGIRNGPALGVLLIIDSIENLTPPGVVWLAKVMHDAITGSYIDYEKDQVSFPVRVVLSGTNTESFWREYKKWETTSGQRRFLRAPHVLELSALEKVHVEELISRRARKKQISVAQGTISDIANKLLYLSGGHPAVINGILDELFEINLRNYDDFLKDNRESLIKKYVCSVSRKVLDHFPLPQAQKDIKTICVFRLIDMNTLNELRTEGLTTSQADMSLVGSLREHKILKSPSREKLFYHDDIIRRILYLDLAFRNREDMEHVQKTHECARELYGRLINNTHNNIHYFFVEWLFHALQVVTLDVAKIELEWNSLLSQIQPVSLPVEDQRQAIKEMLEGDSEVRYLYRERFGSDDFSPLFNS